MDAKIRRMDRVKKGRKKGVVMNLGRVLGIETAGVLWDDGLVELSPVQNLRKIPKEA